VHLFVTEQQRRLGVALADDHQRTERDAVGTARDRPALPEAVAVATFDSLSDALQTEHGSTGQYNRLVSSLRY
jgi:hypothetical protein